MRDKETAEPTKILKTSSPANDLDGRKVKRILKKRNLSRGFRSDKTRKKIEQLLGKHDQSDPICRGTTTLI